MIKIFLEQKNMPKERVYSQYPFKPVIIKEWLK